MKSPVTRWALLFNVGGLIPPGLPLPVASQPNFTDKYFLEAHLSFRRELDEVFVGDQCGVGAERINLEDLQLIVVHNAFINFAEDAQLIALALRILFDGRPDQVTFATLAPPFPGNVPIAFTAVSLSREAAGLTLRQQVLPNLLALDRLAPVLVDPETTGMRFRYLGEQPGAWQDEWDMSREETIPRAVEITLVGRAGTSGGAAQVLTVPIRATMP